MSSSQDSRSSGGEAAGQSPDAPATAAARPPVQTFRSVAAVAVWYLWLVCAVLNLIDLAVQGRDRTAAVLAAAVVLATGIAYLAALRPRILTDDKALTLRNPFRDVIVPWGAVTSIDVKDMIRVHYRVEQGLGEPARERVLRGWAMQSTYRGRVRAQRRARADAAEKVGYARRPLNVQAVGPLPPADRVVARLNEIREAARARGAAGGPPAVAWSWVSFAALAAPVLLLLVAILIP